jgi:hypothetical protein
MHKHTNTHTNANKSRQPASLEHTGTSSPDMDVMCDLHNQEAWIHVVRPRSAMLKFRLPFFKDTDQNYSYLKGEMYLQLFAQKSSTEVRLCVNSPAISTGYERELYNSETHDDCLFYHNCVTRRMHMDSECKIKVSAGRIESLLKCSFTLYTFHAHAHANCVHVCMYISLFLLS